MEESLLQSPPFWVAVAFVVFVALVWKKISKALAKILDTRSNEIAAELAEARRLREEAEATLAQYRTRQLESVKEAEAIIARAGQDAQRMGQQAEADLKVALEKRTRLASDRIAQAEAKALQEVKAHVVDIAVSAARTLIQEQLSRSGGKELTEEAIRELERKLH